MKLLDKYKLSLHNIKNNKSRSILTTVIVYIISLLIMAILCIAISFSTNTSSVIKKYYQESDEPITTNYYLYGKSADGRVFDKSIYESLSNIVDRNSSIISYAKYESNYGSDVTIIDFRFGLNEFYQIMEGSNISELDVGKNSVLVSAEYANQYYKIYGTKLNPGDTIPYSFEYSVVEGDMRTYKTQELELIVKGIFKLNDVDYNDNYRPLISSGTDILIDVEYLFDTISDFTLQAIEYFYNVTKTNFNSNELKDKLDKFVTELRDTLPVETYDNSNVYSNALEDLQWSSILGIVIIGLAAFLCLILILLSIGSLANTIMISVDKNKKFIGLLKALGLNEKDLKSVIKLESITTIVLGIVLAFFTILLLNGALNDLNTLIINAMFSNYVKAVDYKAIFVMPIYVPVIVFVFFISFTLLFARGSMSKIAKTDPMAVISEVA